MHIFCPTPHAVLLVVCQDEKGIYQAVQGKGLDLPGFAFLPRSGVPIQAQLVAVAEKEMGVALPAREFEIIQDVEVQLSYQDQGYTLYVLRLSVSSLSRSGLPGEMNWKILPVLLRQMPATKTRVAYLKVWQWLAGVGDQEIRVVEKK